MFFAKRKLLQTMSAPNMCILPLAVPIPVCMYLNALEFGVVHLPSLEHVFLSGHS